MAPLALPPWIGAAVLAVGVLVLLLAGRSLLTGRRRGRTWLRREGRVVASRLADGGFRYQVAYQDGAQEIRFWNRFTSGSGVDPVGRQVTVLVDPADPRDAVVERGAIGTGAAFAVFGLIAVAAGIFLLSR